MTFTESVTVCFRKYADFKGRASRSEFWWWALFNLIASVCLQVIDERLSLAFTIGTLLPYAAVATRRLHDTDRSGWSQLIGLVPLIGWVLMVVWLAERPRDGNRYND